MNAGSASGMASFPAALAPAAFALALSGCLQPDGEAGKLRSIKYWHSAECGGAVTLSDSINDDLEHVFRDSSAILSKTKMTAGQYADLQTLAAAADLGTLNTRNVPIPPGSCVSTRECRVFNHLTLETEGGTETYSNNQRCIAYDGAYLAAFASLTRALAAARHPLPALPVDTCPGIRDTLLPEKTRLQEQWRKWKARGIGDYSFEYRTICFCGGAGTWYRILVSGGQVLKAETLGFPPVPVDAGRMPTLDSLFLQAAQALCRGSEVKVGYDAAFGYPAQLDIDLRLMPVDGGFTAETRNFNIIFRDDPQDIP